MKSIRKNYDPENLREYIKIGEELKQLTSESIGFKFDINSMAVYAIKKLTDDDVRLIRELTHERQRLLNRRRYLRNTLK